jgi:hypothetical protein
MAAVSAGSNIAAAEIDPGLLPAMESVEQAGDR